MCGNMSVSKSKGNLCCDYVYLHKYPQLQRIEFIEIEGTNIKHNFMLLIYIRMMKKKINDHRNQSLMRSHSSD